MRRIKALLISFLASPAGKFNARRGQGGRGNKRIYVANAPSIVPDFL
jgi:hypothetical protein